MSTLARFDRPGLLERLTNSTAFAVLFGLASLMLAPSVLIGLFVLPALFTPAARANSDPWIWLVLSAGGMVGYVGLFRARRPPSSSADYRATLICLGVGILTGAAALGMLIDSTAFADRFTLGGLVVPAIPIVAAVGRIARLRRLRTVAEGRAPDSLPLIFLSVALGQMLCAIAIGVQLALGG